ncbi:MAG: hypothetical protein O7D94_05290 [Planctomycetota bacterium]|nr:hypothetical protein [Planctomycetota bacterium]
MDKLRDAVNRDERTLYAIARDGGIRYAVLHRVATGERNSVTTATAERVAAAVGLTIELRPVRKTKKGG